MQPTIRALRVIKDYEDKKFFFFGFIKAKNKDHARRLWLKNKYGLAYTVNGGTMLVSFEDIPDCVNQDFIRQSEKTYQWISAMHEDSINGADDFVGENLV